MEQQWTRYELYAVHKLSVFHRKCYACAAHVVLSVEEGDWQSNNAAKTDHWKCKQYRLNSELQTGTVTVVNTAAAAANPSTAEERDGSDVEEAEIEFAHAEEEGMSMGGGA